MNANTIKILVLHNDTDYLRLIGGILKLAGLQFIGTTSKEEAWLILQNNPIDLLIMNWMVSDGEDWEGIYDKMKADPVLSKIGVIITYPRHHGSRDIWANGDRYLAMPFVVADLLIDVWKVLENYAKELPTATEMEIQFEKYRDELKAGYSWSDEKLEEHRQQLLQKAGYT